MGDRRRDVAPTGRFRTSFYTETKAAFAKKDALFRRIEFPSSKRACRLGRTRLTRARKGGRVKLLRKKVKSLRTQLAALKLEKRADAALIQILVNADKEREFEMEHLTNSKKEVEERNAQLQADLEPLQFEVETLRERNEKLAEQVKRCNNRHDHSAAMKCLRAQNQIVKSKVSSLKSELHQIKQDHATETHNLRKQMRSMQKQMKSSIAKMKAKLGAKKSTQRQRSGIGRTWSALNQVPWTAWD